MIHFYHHLLFFIATITFISTTTTTTKVRSTILLQEDYSIYQVLNSNGLPSGLLPKGITNYTINNDGSFKVYLDEPCDTKFESEIHYETSVAGQLRVGQIGNLSGISAQDLFLWFPVKDIRVDIPSSGVIYFDVGVVRKQFSVSLFDTPRDCVAVAVTATATLIDTHPLQKLGGVLRYIANCWWKKEEEIV